MSHAYHQEELDTKARSNRCYVQRGNEEYEGWCAGYIREENVLLRQMAQEALKKMTIICRLLRTIYKKAKEGQVPDSHLEYSAAQRFL